MFREEVWVDGSNKHRTFTQESVPRETKSALSYITSELTNASYVTNILILTQTMISYCCLQTCELVVATWEVVYMICLVFQW